MGTRRRFLQHSGAAAAALGMPTWVGAQGVGRLTVGFAPGGTVDVIARRLGESMTGAWAPSVIVDNRPGAGGRIAIEAARNAAPDGLTAVLTPSSMIDVYPHVYKRLSYQPATDLIAVTPVCSNALAFVIGPAVPESVRTLAQFVTWARTAQAAYATPAAGSILHFMGIVFREQAGIDLIHTPYRGMAPAIQDLAAGNVHSCLGTLGDFLPQLSQGRLRPLAVTSEQRSRFMPEVPTFAELGYPKVTGLDWFGLFLPARTPPEAVARFDGAVRGALKTRALRDTLDQMGFDPLELSPADFARRIAAETAYWGPIVAASGFSAED